MPTNTNSPITVNAYINGQNVESNKHVPRENPANPDEIVGYFPDNTLEETKAAIDAAAEAFKTWSKTSVDERISKMMSASEKIKAKIDELGVLLALEHGKPLYDAKGEVTISTMWMDYQSGIVKEQIKDDIFEDEIEHIGHDHRQAAQAQLRPITIAVQYLPDFRDVLPLTFYDNRPAILDQQVQFVDSLPIR